MKALGYIAAAAGAAALIALALVWGFGQRDGQVAAPATTSPTPSATATASPSPATTAPASTTAPATTPAATAGTITGELGYPSEFVPPLTVYAISAADPNVWYSTDTPHFGNAPSPSPSTATWPPSGPGTYRLAVPPGTYYVLGYRNDQVNEEARRRPGVYSRYTLECIRPSTGASPPPACSRNDHTLVPVTVRAGETVANIDVKDWYYGPDATYPPRPTPR